MKISVKSLFPLILIIMILFVIPQSFAGDIDNTTIDNQVLSSDDSVDEVNEAENHDNLDEDDENNEYKYVTKPANSSVEYFIGESCVVDVTAEYESEDYWTSVDLRGSEMYVYINGNTSGIRLENIPSESKSFSVDINDIDYTFEAGKTYSLLFHAPKGIIEYANLNIDEDCKFDPVTVKVINLADYNYTTYISPSNVIYVRGESKNVTVKAHIDPSINLDGQSMSVWINDKNYTLEGINANETLFDLDLASISDKLNDGQNLITIHPDTTLIGDNYHFYPLKVYVLFGDAVYVSKEGDDSNIGSATAPVASISQAVTICKNTGISKIYIFEGTYYEDSIIVDISVDIRAIGNVTIDAEQKGRIFKITGENIVGLSGLTLINGYAPTDGVSWDIHEVVYYAAGGAIDIYSVYVTMENMTFINNVAEEFGGAINVEAPYFNMYNCTFIGNEAGVYGGAVDIEDLNATIDNCRFISNVASNGGAIGWIGANATLINSHFENNMATDVGGAVFIQNTDDSNGNLIENCKFIGNEAPQQGGAIEVENENMQMAEFTVIRKCQFINNSAFNGGAISAYYGDTASLDNIFINNTAGYGGAIAGIGTKSYFNFVGSMYLRNNTIINCTASENGHAIFNMGLIESWLNITFINGEHIYSPEGKAVDLTVSVFDDMGNPISGSPLNFTVNGKATINPASDLINGYGGVHFVPRENGTFTVSGIYGTQWYMENRYDVVTGLLTVDNAIPDYFGTIYVSQANGDDDNTGSEGSPVKTFNQAFILATRAGGSFNIVVLPGTYDVSRCILHQSFNVTGIGNPTLNGKNEATLFSLYGFEEDEFHFTGLTFINGIANPSLYSGMNDGGAIFFKGGNLYLDNDTFMSCSANDYGGAVYINKGLDMNSGRMYTAYAYINNCTFKNNVAKYFGGAVALYDSSVIVTNSTFTSNSAKKGGAICILEGMANLTVINCTFDNNKASDSGGALNIEALNTYNVRYYAEVHNSTFTSNSAPIGGAIIGSDAVIMDSTFTKNSANNYGGAIVITDQESIVQYSIFKDNEAVKGKAYYGNSTAVNDNYWGGEFQSADELVNQGIVNINESRVAPSSWSNTEVIDKKPSADDNSTSDNKLSTSLKTQSQTFKVTLTSKTLTATLKDINGNALSNKKLIFTINGKKYNANTNSKGVATVKVSLNAVKSYGVVVTFEGDDKYVKSSAKATVKVIKEKSKIKVSKKSTKTKKITITLKSASGKALSKKKVTLKINGKKYTAKTNKKGKAVIKVKISKKKTYKVKVTFKGDKQFNKVTKTAKVKII